MATTPHMAYRQPVSLSTESSEVIVATVKAVGHRLYLSAMSVLLVSGLGIFGSALVAFIHDRNVTREDRECFATRHQTLSAQSKTLAAIRVSKKLGPELPPGAVLDPPPPGLVVRSGNFDPDEYLATRDLDDALNSCRLYISEYLPLGRSNRSWLDQDEVALGLTTLALLPALLLWLAAIWARWLFKPGKA